MSKEILRYAIQHVHVPTYEKCVLTLLAYYSCEPHGLAWPSQSRLARECGMTERGLAKLLALLHAKGMIHICRKVRPRFGNRYRIVTPERYSGEFSY